MYETKIKSNPITRDLLTLSRLQKLYFLLNISDNYCQVISTIRMEMIVHNYNYMTDLKIVMLLSDPKLNN